MAATQSRYAALIEKIFFDRYNDGDTAVSWQRDDVVEAAETLGIELPKNLGDIVYSFRYRTQLPDSILRTQPDGQEWIIVGTGVAQYSFRLVGVSRIVPNENLVEVKVPDATPEVIRQYSFSDEQALLAIVRYNRLIDVFLGLTAFSLQNHLRTTVAGTGQIEIDEIYVGIDSRGSHYVIPVQAKGGTDQLGTVQTRQDIDCCVEKFPTLIPRAVSTQFMGDDLIALFELTLEDDVVKIVQERHYHLVPGDEISADDLKAYALRS